ncbi:hypothetical protein [Ensifer sp. CCNWLY38]|uniref:hypothetical protein n=1 Tax=unclassified Ensifer TaxID=2633371 RepID=UPI003FA5D713
MTHSRSLPRLVRKLEEALGPAIRAALDDPSVVEIMLNADGSLYVERLGQSIARLGEMDTAAAEITIGSIAHATGTAVDEHRPIVSAELPVSGHRFEGLLPPIVAAPSFSIRKRASRLIPLEQYVDDGFMTGKQARLLARAVVDRLKPIGSPMRTMRAWSQIRVFRPNSF